MSKQLLWDNRLLQIAYEIAKWSKDDSHKVGAVVASKDNRIVSTGYNGPPRGVEYVDLEKRVVVHAEVNAILNARCDIRNHTLYVSTFFPCVNCATIIVQAGIDRIVCPNIMPKEKFLPEEARKIFELNWIEVVYLT